MVELPESRSEFLARVAAAHDAWVQRHLDDSAFDPDPWPVGSDYNVWHVDMDADPAAHDELMKAIGPIPRTFADDPPETDEDEEPVP